MRQSAPEAMGKKGKNDLTEEDTAGTVAAITKLPLLKFLCLPDFTTIV